MSHSVALEGNAVNAPARRSSGRNKPEAQHERRLVRRTVVNCLHVAAAVSRLERMDALLAPAERTDRALRTLAVSVLVLALAVAADAPICTCLSAIAVGAWNLARSRTAWPAWVMWATLAVYGSLAGLACAAQVDALWSDAPRWRQVVASVDVAAAIALLARCCRQALRLI